MSLSFCIGIDGNTCTGVSFERQPHELIFTRFGLPEGEFPLFKRLQSYWSDTKYELWELDELIKEIKQIRIHFSSNKQLSQQIEEIYMVCVRAKETGVAVWVYCD